MAADEAGAARPDDHDPSEGPCVAAWFCQIAERTLDGLSIVEAVSDASGTVVDFVFRFSNP